MNDTNFQELINQAMNSSVNIPQELKAYLSPYLDIDRALVEISPRGNCKQVKTNAPKNGVYKFVWRMARFNSGADVTLPVTASWALTSELKSFLPDTKDSAGGFNHEAYTRKHTILKDVESVLDALSMVCVKLMGINPYSGAMRWKGLV